MKTGQGAAPHASIAAVSLRFQCPIHAVPTASGSRPAPDAVVFRFWRRIPHETLCRWIGKPRPSTPSTRTCGPLEKSFGSVMIEVHLLFERFVYAACAVRANQVTPRSSLVSDAEWRSCWYRPSTPFNQSSRKSLSCCFAPSPRLQAQRRVPFL